MITDLSSYVINSYYCQTLAGKTNQINYSFDLPQSYLETVTHMSVISLSIPATWYQLADSDYIILVEGSQSVKIVYSDGNYNQKSELIIDLQEKLNNNSPNGYTYTVVDYDTLSKIKLNAIKISCSNINENVSIKIPDNHLRIMYGLGEINNFINGSLLTSSINLTPISTLYVHSSACTSFNNSGIQSSDIVASLNIVGGNTSSLNPLGINTSASYSLKGNMKHFSGQKSVTFSITDFDNELIDLNGNNWDIQICLFKYEEILIEKFKLYIEYELIKDHVKENEYGIVQNY